MTAPRHLWSGDWRRESADAAEALARRQAPSEEPSAEPPPSPSEPATPSPWARALARARSLSLPAAVVTTVAVLLAAGVGYAAVSLVRGGDGGPSVSGRATSAWLGVKTMNLAPADGVTIVNVTAGSPADQAGLHAGDVIIQIGNQPVQTPRDLESALAEMHAGQQVQIEYDRGPILLTTQATLRARPANGP